MTPFLRVPLRTSLLALAALAAACGGKRNPAPTPTPTGGAEPQGQGTEGCAEGVPSTAEQCECQGYTVVGDIGDGQVACPEGTREVSRIQYGIEGGVCCAAATAP